MCVCVCVHAHVRSDLTFSFHPLYPSRFLSPSFPLFLPSLDMILDMLRSEDARTAILSYYQESDEPRAVRAAIKESCMTPAGESGLQK